MRSIYRRILSESKMVPSSANKGKEDKYDVPSRVKEKSGFDKVDEFPDFTDEENNYNPTRGGRSQTEINRNATAGDQATPSVKQETYTAVEYLDILAEMNNEDLSSFITEGWESASKSRPAALSLRKHATDLLEARTAAAATIQTFKAGKVKLGDGSFAEIDDLQAHCLNKLMKSTPRPESLDKLARKNATEFTSILQFAKSLD